MSKVLKGQCRCGACRFELTGPSNFVGHCHCDSCRRATGSPMTTWIGHPDGQWSWSGDKPLQYESSSGKQWGFCGVCGSPMFYRSDTQPGETHFYAAQLVDPEEVDPRYHFHSDEQLSWLHLNDDLERR